MYTTASLVLPEGFEAVYLSGAEDLYVIGGDFDEELYGNDGNNLIDGGGGSDYMAGGLGNDTYVVDDVDDEIVEEIGEGTDTVQVSFDYSLGLNLENLVLTGTAVLGEGNELANKLTGNDGDNELYGFEGNDELNGGAGSDDLYGAEGDDVYRFGIGSGQDTVHDLVGLNTVRLLGDLTGADLTVAQVGSDIVVSINGTTDSITLVGWAGVPILSSGNLRLCECGCPVTTVNGAPVAALDMANLIEDSVLTATGNVLGNDIDPDAGTTLTVTDPRTVVTIFGTLTLAANGSYTFDLNNAGVQFMAAGQTFAESFSYTITDGHPTDPRTATSTLIVTINGANDAPVANDDTGSVTEDGGLTATGLALANDVDIDQGTVLSVSDPGTRTGTYGSLVLSGTGSYTYTLNNASALVQSLGQGETEVEVFNYTARDNAASPLTDGATITITVAGANDAPILVTPLSDQNGEEGEAFTVTVPAGTFTDIDRNDSLSYTATLLNGDPLPTWLSFNPTTRQISGTPTTGSAGTYQIRVIATDLFGASANDVFALTVAASDPEDDTFCFTDDGCWGEDDYSASCVKLVDTNSTYSVYNGGSGTDTLLGTCNNDAILLEDNISPFPEGLSGPRLVSIEVIDAGDGNDVVDLWSSLYTYGDVTVHGGNGEDRIVGGNGVNTLFGDDGDDKLTGGNANDVLDGGAGNDQLTGGLGDDTYYVDSKSDWVIENEGEGLDTVYATDSYEMAAHVENLTLLGTAICGDGNDQDNLIIGNAQDNILSGNGGDDIVVGGLGNDVYYVDDEHDIVTENAGEGIDEIRTRISFTLQANIEKLTLLDVEAWDRADAIGNELDNLITGSNCAATSSTAAWAPTPWSVAATTTSTSSTTSTTRCGKS